MLKLIICIELLAGSYNIIIDGDYIITIYFFEEEQNDNSILLSGVIDTKNNLLHHFENNKLTKSYDLEHINTKASSLKMLSFEKTNDSKIIANTLTEKYVAKYNIKNYLNGRGDADIAAELYFADVEIINQYVPEEYRKRLIFIGTDYDMIHKYKLQNIEVTHGEPVLISEVTKIYEVDYLPSGVYDLLSKINVLAPVYKED